METGWADGRGGGDRGDRCGWLREGSAVVVAWIYGWMVVACGGGYWGKSRTIK
jgi:hypothetical protein